MIFWSYLIPEGAIGTQVEHVSLSSVADGSEKTNKDSVMLIMVATFGNFWDGSRGLQLLSGLGVRHKQRESTAGQEAGCLCSM